MKNLRRKLIKKPKKRLAEILKKSKQDINKIIYKKLIKKLI